MLAHELEAEYSGIFNWLMEGRKMFVENGYKLPPDQSMKEYVRECKAEYNTALTFMAKKGYRPRISGVDLAPRNSVNAKALYNEYMNWCNANGVECLTRLTFYNTLEREGYVKSRHNNGMVFYVFGDITLNSFVKDARRIRQENALKKAPSSQIMWIEGKAYLSSMIALAGYAGIGQSVVQRLNREGKFDEHKRGYKNKSLFEVDGCMDVMRQLKVVATDDEKNLQMRLQKELKYMRRVFNQRMEYHGLPYRKYTQGDQILDNIIVVPDEMTVDEVVARAKKEFGFDGEIRNGEGAFGRGGKGYFKDADDIPTDEEKEYFYRKPKPHKTKRNE